MLCKIVRMWRIIKYWQCFSFDQTEPECWVGRTCPCSLSLRFREKSRPDTVGKGLRRGKEILRQNVCCILLHKNHPFPLYFNMFSKFLQKEIWLQCVIGMKLSKCLKNIFSIVFLPNSGKPFQASKELKDRINNAAFQAEIQAELPFCKCFQFMPIISVHN